MKRLSFVIMLVFLLVVVVCSTGSAFEKKNPNAPVLHECVFVYDVEGEEQTLTAYAEECPDDPDWWDNGPVAVSDMSVPHECVFTSDIDGEQRTFIFAGACPEDEGWWDNGPVDGAATPDSANGMTPLRTTATTTSTLRKCMYETFDPDYTEEMYRITFCALQCPVGWDWFDMGPCP